MSLTKPHAVPLRPLLLIAAAVALAHAALLQALPTALPVAAPTVVQALNTRSIAVPTAATAAPAPPAPRPPKKRPAPPATPALPAPAANVPPEPSPAPAPEPEPVPEPPVAAASAPEPAAPEPVAVASAPAPAASAPAVPVVPLTTATVFAFPDPVRLLYELNGESKKMVYHARGDLLWQHDGQRYDATLSASMLFLGSRTYSSTGNITPQGLAPTRFADKWRTELAAHFDQAHQRATFSANTPEVALLGAAQDQLSVILQIAGILAAEPAKFPPGAGLALQTIGTKDGDIWQFTVEGPERLRVPSGELDTTKLTRKPRREYDKKVEVWLAPAMGYLPVRLKITNANGDFVDQQLRGVEKP